MFYNFITSNTCSVVLISIWNSNANDVIVLYSYIIGNQGYFHEFETHLESTRISPKMGPQAKKRERRRRRKSSHFFAKTKDR